MHKISPTFALVDVDLEEDELRVLVGEGLVLWGDHLARTAPEERDNLMDDSGLNRSIFD